MLLKDFYTKVISSGTVCVKYLQNNALLAVAEAHHAMSAIHK